MRQHHAFRTPRRAGREADRRKGIFGQIVDDHVVAGLREKGRRGGAALSVVRAQYDDRRQRMPGLGETRETRGNARALDDQQPRLRVIHAPCDIVGIVVDVQRNHDQSQAQRGLVDGDPVDAVARAQRDALAGLQSFAPERRLPAADTQRHFIDGDVLPRFSGEMAVQHAVRVSPDAGRKAARCWRASGPPHPLRRGDCAPQNNPRRVGGLAGWLYLLQGGRQRWPRSRSPANMR